MVDSELPGARFPRKRPGGRGGHAKGAEVWRCNRNVDLGGLVRADLDALLTAIYVLVDDFLPERQGPGAPPRITDAELVTLAIAQVFLGLPNDRQFLALARYRLGHLFPYLPKQPGYNKRLRRLVPQIARSINYLAFSSPSFCDAVRLLDSTPVPCGQSRETTRRSEFAGLAGYGYCRSHSRYFWGFRLYLLCARDGTPIGFELAPANAPEREVAKELLERVPLAGYAVVADKGFAGHDFERFVAAQGASLLRPDRRDEQPRFGSLGTSARASNRSSGPARASSGSNATAPAPCPASAPASGCACSPSPPASGTTGRSATPAATSPP